MWRDPEKNDIEEKLFLEFDYMTFYIIEQKDKTEYNFSMVRQKHTQKREKEV